MYCKNVFKHTTAALALGLIGIATTPAAQAALYHSDLLVQVSLTGVSGGILGTDATATFENLVFGSPAATSTGPAWASTDPYLYANNTLSYLEHDQNVNGEAYGPGGNAYSELLTNGYIHLSKTSTEDVTFTFDYLIQGGANVSGPGFADAFGSAEITDSNYQLSPIYQMMSVVLGGPETTSLNQTGTFSVTLGSGITNNDISVLVTNNGSAVTPVPIPGSFAMMMGALGILGSTVRRNKQAIA